MSYSFQRDGLLFIQLIFYFCCVKILCVFIAILVLFLSVQPVCTDRGTEDVCCLATVCTDNDCSEERDAHPTCVASCNPFQSCSCCVFAAMAVPKVHFTLPNVAAFAKPQWPEAAPPQLLAPVLSFWQPPKIA